MTIIELKTARKVNNTPPLAVALGNFDGVHLGHRRVIEAAVAAAKISGDKIKSAVWCFEQNPKISEDILTPPEEKAEIFRSLGADYVIFEDFYSVCGLSPSEFVLNYLKELSAVSVFCGFNFRFGKNAAGNKDTLTELSEKSGISASALPAVEADALPVSSTVIRALIKEGRMEEAEKLLCRPYSVTGEVTHGRHLGNTLGFPTINQNFENGKAVPRHGVYFTETEIDGEIFPSVSNVGVRPTVNGKHVRLETHVIDFEGDLYGKNVTVKFKKFCRPEKKFSSEEELKSAVLSDVKNAKYHFSKEAHPNE